MRSNPSKMSWVAALALLGAACAEGDAESARETAPAEAVAAAPALLTVTASDFQFQTARTTPAGITNIRLVNQGPDFHHVLLVRLEDGHTVEELVDQIARTGEHLPAWATMVGGPNSPAPGGGVSEATVDLEPGEYAMVCVIPTDGVPHVMKGMAVPLTVTPTSATTPAPAPANDTQILLTDYAFAVTPELSAGNHTIKVTNQASQPHEVFIAKLAPGTTAAELLVWLEKPEGPPPGTPLGGASPLATGETNYLTLDLTPGEYALICFVADVNDKRPHFAHGMVQQITVR